jgi:hypothetical protein
LSLVKYTKENRSNIRHESLGIEIFTRQLNHLT